MSSPLEQLKGVKENEPLAPYTTFKIGGPAKYFFIAKTSDDIVKAVEMAKKLKMPYFILGGGSNLLVSDQGFDGLVIKILDSRFKISDLRVEVAAGALLSTVVGKSVEAGLTGLEWAAGIYGTIGGAVRGNAGAFGHEMSEVVESVRIMNQELPARNASASVAGGRIKNLKNKECGFGYRDSIFKQDKNLIILEVVLKLGKGDKEKGKQEVKNILQARRERQPLEFPSAGSVFKNVEIANLSELKTNLRESLPEEFIAKGKIPAAWLIEEVNLKGKKIGGAEVSDKHANFIVNTGQATASNVLALISLIKMKVRDDLGIQLEEEIELVGF